MDKCSLPIIIVCGLAYECPKGKIRDKECPLRELEFLSFSEKVHWIDQIDYEQINEILEHHKICSRQK
ncbi:hypothetical protein LH29_07940 [Draconibacterium sediminis]|uniref:Uncharacterized protein n=1 Tax=Draconibacterium sediminis TaxID=1544798 RepID=A0A0D8JEH5_9BACT|nr:hypothetical protein LH29_07940 [Draconibacterium sediminis]